MTVTPLLRSLYSPKNIARFFEQQDECSLYACLLIGNSRIDHHSLRMLLMEAWESVSCRLESRI